MVLMGSCSSSDDLQWHQEEGYQWAELSPGFFGSTGFKKVDASDSNIDFINSVSRASIEENRNFLNGSGVTTADVDGDGWVDIYLASLEGPNKLYRNIGGLQFVDITEEANLAHKGYNSTGVIFADVNGDSHPDLLITSLTKENVLYINDGKGRFTLKENSGLQDSRGSNTMALADIDADGDLDLYISNYKLKTVRDLYSADELSTENTVRKQGDSLVVVPPFDQYYGIIKTDGRSYRNEYGAKDHLYINRGDGTFEKVTDEKKHFLNAEGRPVGLFRDWGLTAKFQDINSDGHPDLFVANDFWTPDRLWMNQGDGTFRSADKHAIRSMSFSSMGVDFSDINRDGFTDFFVSEMLSSRHQRRLRQLSEHLDPIDGRPQYNRNSLYLNRGDHTFAEISSYANVTATEWSWATNFLDIDLDGYEDLILTTGYAFDYQDLDTQIELNRQTSRTMQSTGDILRYPRLDLPNRMLRNNQDLTFTDKSESWGFTEDDISLGMAIADLDNDGDADFVINRFNTEAVVYQNQTSAPRIAVTLKGKPPNTAGIGAKIRLEGAKVVQQKQISAGGSYVSGSQPMAFFAADPENINHQLTVTWPDESVSTIDGVQSNRVYVVDQSSAVMKSRRDSSSEGEPPLFRDASDQIAYVHHEDRYTDFNVQPLLPALLSRQGPGVGWMDYDRDGYDDLFITSGKGGQIGIFRNNGNSELERTEIEELSRSAGGDQTGLAGWQTEKRLKLVLGSANFEQGSPQVPSGFMYNIDNTSADVQELPGVLSTTGPVAASDYDGDGDLDLFIGGAFMPGEYPRNASSRLFRNENGHFVRDPVNSRRFNEIGLVSGAVFTDYDRDGDPDLVLSRSWDSIALLENRDGNFIDVSTDYGFNNYKGWWHGVATGDFNGDGCPDIVATNIGSNSIYKPTGGHPLKLFYGDFDVNGTLDIIDSYYESDLQAYVPRRKLYEMDSMPSLLGRITSHKQYARSSVGDIVGQDPGTIPSREINTVQHMIFLSSESGFSAYPLPRKAQFSAAFHAGTADFNNDGKEDLFLSQNDFSFPSGIFRLDAGRGLLLLGDGHGHFRAVPGHQSGIEIYGEQRGAAVSDFNKDGRADLAVSQNGGPAVLYINQAQRQGLYVRLIGPAGNRNAIGSSMRLVYEDGSKGPAREIQAGSGYRSQHSAAQVLGTEEKASSLEIRWFDGTTEIRELSEEGRAYTFRY
ncbi:CRTAC1 family protein [Fodinibius sediminis]|nr:CRTAC1 family protein [Fodinibius sediminis]